MRSFVICITFAMLPAAALARDPQLGLVVQNNIAAQAVDMVPSYAGVPQPGANGVMAQEAQRRYVADKVKQPPTLRGTSQLGQQVSTAQGGNLQQ